MTLKVLNFLLKMKRLYKSIMVLLCFVLKRGLIIHKVMFINMLYKSK